MISSLRAKLRNSLVGWQIKNISARLNYLRTGTKLSPAEVDIYDQLRRDGIAITSVNSLFDPEILRELRTFVDHRRSDPGVQEKLKEGGRPTPEERKDKESFLVDLWPGAHVLDLENPFIRFSLSDPLLDIVASYLGVSPKFREFFLQITVPVSPGTTPYASQRWHADPDDRRMSKVFVYLSDVDSEAGPFSYIRGSHDHGKWRHLFPYAPKTKTRHPDPEFIKAHIPAEDIVVATGQTGTLIFCDTSGVHRGGYATGRERVMFTGVYTTPASALPSRYSCHPNFRLESLSHASARFAVLP